MISLTHAREGRDPRDYRAGKVDRLPWGVATLALLKDKRVLREGTFSGLQEVKA